VENSKLNQVEGKAVVTVPLNFDGVNFNVKGSAGGSYSGFGTPSPTDENWKYSFGVEAEAKNSRFKTGVVFSGDKEEQKFTAGFQYVF
jgi:hypothetical protein